MGKKIYLVDDDRNILTSVSMALETEGFSVKTFTDGEVGLAGLIKGSPDVAVIDIKMPKLNGIDLLKKLREKSDIPVIFLTSKDTEIDELLGFKIGADDYITKPFSQKILIERIRVLLKRKKINEGSGDTKSKSKISNIIKKGNILLDKEQYTCRWKNKMVNMTVTEFLIIESLIEKPGVVKSREQLINAAFGGENESQDERSIDHHLKRIRKKFKNTDKSFDNLTTIYGIGYKFSE